MNDDVGGDGSPYGGSPAAAGNRVEANATLVKRKDGWRIELVFDDGTVAAQEQPPFASKEEAQDALDAWCEANDIHRTVPQ